MERKACPGCGAKAFRILGPRGSAFQTAAGGSTFLQPEYEVRSCDSCGLYYKSHILSSEELSEYYEQIDFSKWDIGKLFPSEHALLEILSTLPAGSRILDYGCSAGRLLSHLKNGYERFGIETNQDAARLATDRGLTIIPDLAVGNFAQSSFDGIVLSDVFEHLVNPTESLAVLRKRLAKGGYLILFTGDGDAKACQRDVANFWYFRTPEHLCMLNRKHADYLAGKLDLQLISWTQMSHYDCTRREVARQYIQDFAYWQFRCGRSSLLKSVLKITPMLRRARDWDTPPPIIYTKDHVLAVFQSPAE